MLFQTLETQQCSLPNPPSRYLVRSGLARPLANQNIEPQLKQAVSKKNYAGSGGSYEPELQHLQLGGTYLSIEKTTVRIHTSFMQTFTYAQRVRVLMYVQRMYLSAWSFMACWRQCTGLASSMGFFLGLAYLSFLLHCFLTLNLPDRPHTHVGEYHVGVFYAQARPWCEGGLLAVRENS